MRKIIESIKNNKLVLIYLCMAFVASSCLLVLGVYKGHDYLFHLGRLHEIAVSFENLKNYAFDSLYPDYFNDYGYAIGLFYPGLFLYLPAILMVVFDLNELVAYNIMIAGINLIAVINMYWCMKTITKNKLCGLICSLIFVLSPYYLTDTYIRSALGEQIAFAFFPLVILGLYELIYDDYKKKGIYLTIGIAGIALSHILSILFCIILVAIIGLINIKKIFSDKNRLKYCLIYGLLSIGIAAYFLVPMLEMLLSDTYLYSVDVVTNLFEKAIPWRNCILESVQNSELDPWCPFGIGLVYVLLGVLAVFVKVNYEYNNSFANILIVLGIIFLFMTTDLFPWNRFTILNIIQFPWRFLLLSTVCFVVGFGLYLNRMLSGILPFVALNILIIPFLLFTMNNLNQTVKLEPGFDWSDYHYKTCNAEYLPYVGESDFSKGSIEEYISERGETITSNNSINYEFDRDYCVLYINYSDNYYEDTYIDLPLIYYKGYKAVEDGQNLEVEKSDTGLVRIHLTNESGSIRVYYGYTTGRFIGIGTTMISLVILIYVYRKKDA